MEGQQGAGRAEAARTDTGQSDTWGESGAAAEAETYDDWYDETDALLYQGYQVLERDGEMRGNEVSFVVPEDRLLGEAPLQVRSGRPRVQYYHSGVNQGRFFRWLHEERERGMDAGGMLNAHSAAQPSVAQGCKAYPHVPIVIDFGAFQGGMTVERYVGVLRRLESLLPGRLFRRVDWVSVLDEVGASVSGRVNYEEMKFRYGIEPLYVAQVRSQRATGRPQSWKNEVGYVSHHLDETRMISIGGLVGVFRTSSYDGIRLMENIGRWLERIGRCAHFFGIGAAGVMRAFRDEPWFASADSQKWLAGKKARKLYRTDGSSIMAQKIGLQLTRETCARQNMRQIAGWAGAVAGNETWSDLPIRTAEGHEMTAEEMGLCLAGQEVYEYNAQIQRATRARTLFCGDVPRVHTDRVAEVAA